MRGLEVDIDGLSPVLDPEMEETKSKSFLNQELSLAGADRLLYVVMLTVAVILRKNVQPDQNRSMVSGAD